jgi:uncharacterized protein
MPALWLTTGAHLAGYKMFVEFFGAPFLSLAVAVTLASLIEKGSLTLILKPFQTVGKVALSVYLLQSIICTTVFYSYGFGLFATLTRVDSLKVVGLVWLICWFAATLWLKFFWIGPIEALWRSLAEQRKIDLRRPPITPPPIAG